MILVTGGSASGKSAFAEGLAMKHDSGKKLYIATMKPSDEECQQRIEKHRLLRKDKNFETVECFDLSLREAYDEKYSNHVGLFECMSNYLSNVMFHKENYFDYDKYIETGWTEKERNQFVDAMVNELILLDQKLDTLIVVTNEVFSDGKKYDQVTTEYLHILADCNRKLAQYSKEVYEVVCGIEIRRK